MASGFVETDVGKIKHVRPPVISIETCDESDEYRGFHHVVKNVYTFNLLAAKTKTAC